MSYTGRLLLLYFTKSASYLQAMAYQSAEMKLNKSSRAPDQITLQLKLHKKESKSYIHTTANIVISTAIVFSMVNCA